jgi:hypothetical protein
MQHVGRGRDLVKQQKPANHTGSAGRLAAENLAGFVHCAQTAIADIDPLALPVYIEDAFLGIGLPAPIGSPL